MAKKYTPKKAKDNEVLLKDWAIPIAEANDEVIFDAVNGHIDGTNDRHNAKDVDFGGDETVKDKLDTLINTTEELSDNKVDKVDGKSLIDKGVADKLTADGDRIRTSPNTIIEINNHEEFPSNGTEISPQKVEVWGNGGSEVAILSLTHLKGGGIDSTIDGTTFQGQLTLNSGGIDFESWGEDGHDVVITQYDSEFNEHVHKLTQKADIADLDGKLDKNKAFTLVDSSSDSVYGEYSAKKIQLYDGYYAFAETTIQPTGITGTGSDGSYSLKIGNDGGLRVEDVGNGTDIIVSKYNGSGEKTIHKLSEKANKSEVLSSNMTKDTVIKIGDPDIEQCSTRYSINDIRFVDHGGNGDTVYSGDSLQIRGNGTHRVVIDNQNGINVSQVFSGMDTADITLELMDPNTYETVTHKLSEKANTTDVNALVNEITGATTIAEFETLKLDNSGWDGGSQPETFEVDLNTVKELYVYGGTGRVQVFETNNEDFSIAATRDEAVNLIPIIKQKLVIDSDVLTVYIMTDGIFYADIGKGAPINEYVEAIPKIYEESGSLYVNVGDKKFKLTAAEV